MPSTHDCVCDRDRGGFRESNLPVAGEDVASVGDVAFGVGDYCC